MRQFSGICISPGYLFWASGSVASLCCQFARPTPLVYTVENTGAGLSPTATLPAWASLPIIRQLPDPFMFFNGTRDTTWPPSSNTAKNG